MGNAAATALCSFVQTREERRDLALVESCGRKNTWRTWPTRGTELPMGVGGGTPLERPRPSAELVAAFDALQNHISRRMDERGKGRC